MGDITFVPTWRGTLAYRHRLFPRAWRSYYSYSTTSFPSIPKRSSGEAKFNTSSFFQAFNGHPYD
jgi:hypothetical protein